MRVVTFSVLLAASGRLVTAVPSAGCTAATIPVPALETRITTNVTNSNRTYLYWLPPLYDPTKPAPVIFSYHGVRQSPVKQANLDSFANARFNPDMIAVYPQAIKPPGSDEVMFQGPKQATQDDVTFTMDILNDLEAMFCVDTDRIYASGKSEGAGFVGVLACNATSNSRIAAFAPVSGAFYPGNNDESTKRCKTPVPIPCDPQRCNVPFLEFHGGADFLAPIDGGLQRHECLPNIRDYMQTWVARNGLNSTPTETYNLSPVAEVYKYGEDGLVTWVYDGPRVEHDWPWTVRNPDTIRAHDSPATFNATPFIMDWFNNFTLAHTTGCNLTGK